MVHLSPTAGEYNMWLRDCRGRNTDWSGMADTARWDGRLLLVHHYPVPHAFSVPKLDSLANVASVVKSRATRKKPVLCLTPILTPAARIDPSSYVILEPCRSHHGR